jgi:hypothetical protein
MFDKNLVRKALSRSLNPDIMARWPQDNHLDNQDRLVSLLIHDFFGGEILKTHKKSGWHFYNRINGERIDMVNAHLSQANVGNSFEDLPSTPEETLNFVAQEDYSTSLVRFIRAFEEAVGLEKYRTRGILA